MQQVLETTTPNQYIASLPEPRRSELSLLHERIRDGVPHLEAWMVYGMIGYGQVPRFLNKRKPRLAPIVSVAAKIRHIHIYVGGQDTTMTLDREWANQLGDVTIAGCCIRFKHLTGVNLDALIDLILKTSPPSEGD